MRFFTYQSKLFNVEAIRTAEPIGNYTRIYFSETHYEDLYIDYSSFLIYLENSKKNHIEDL